MAESVRIGRTGAPAIACGKLVCLLVILAACTALSSTALGNENKSLEEAIGQATNTVETSGKSGSDIQIIDGDTIRLRDGKSDVRLVGFNAPETIKARCDTERERGFAAKRRLQSLVDSARSLELHYVACACPPSTEGTQACNFGRRCGVLKVDEIDVGTRLIAEGLAVSFVCKSTSCPATPRPWCKG